MLLLECGVVAGVWCCCWGLVLLLGFGVVAGDVVLLLGMWCCCWGLVLLLGCGVA